MNTGRPLLTSNIRKTPYVFIIFLLALGILFVVLAVLFGWTNMKAIVSSEPWVTVPTFLILFALFFLLPTAALFRLKKIVLFGDNLLISYPFKNKKEIVPYTNIRSFHTRKIYYRGVKESIHIRLKNNKKIILTSVANDNYDHFVMIISKHATREPYKAIHWV